MRCQSPAKTNRAFLLGSFDLGRIRCRRARYSHFAGTVGATRKTAILT
ncbi:hypothetical protein [Zymomonas mobilis]